MKRFCNLLLVVFCFFSLRLLAQEKPFWNEIRAFQIEDSLQKPADDINLFIGSSSFRLWKTIKQDLNSSNILNRAFGGSTLLDVIFYEKQIALNYNPKKIFIYCGENDLASSNDVTSKEVFKRFKKLFSDSRQKFPNTPIVYISIKPSPSRWYLKDKIIKVNQLINRFLNRNGNSYFVNIWDKMLINSTPRKDIFLEDNLHMNHAGYMIWANELKSFIEN